MPLLRPIFVACAILSCCSLFPRQALGDAGDKQDGLVYDEIDKTQKFTGTDAKGWVTTTDCADDYCVHVNREFADGRGIALVTNDISFDRAKRLLSIRRKGRAEDISAPPYTLSQLASKEVAYVANTTIRRGTHLLSSVPPILIVHKTFLDEASGKDQARLLEKALQLLPDETRQKFYTQNPGSGKGGRRIRQALVSQPFEADLGSAGFRADPEHHHVHYPEAAGLRHECRPNSIYFISPNLSLNSKAARKITPGQELTIAHVNPFLPREDRQKALKRLRGHSAKCTCAECTGGGDVTERNKADARLEGLLAIEKRLKDPESTDVTPGMIARYIDLYKEDRLESRFADAYWLAALNYNYLGELEAAVKHANRALQAAIVENGEEDNNLLAEIRVMVKDPAGHYSYKFKLKK